MAELEKEIGDLMRCKGLTLALVESATGGLVSNRITNIAGCSHYYRGSITAYSNSVKMRVVGVKKETLDHYGAVSYQVAQEMAQGGKKILAADICMADTGIAGPAGSTLEKSVGLFYMGLAYKNETYTQQHIFQGNRKQNKAAAAEALLVWLKEYLVNLK